MCCVREREHLVVQHLAQRPLSGSVWHFPVEQNTCKILISLELFFGESKQIGNFKFYKIIYSEKIQNYQGCVVRRPTGAPHAKRLCCEEIPPYAPWTPHPHICLWWVLGKWISRNGGREKQGRSCRRAGPLQNDCRKRKKKYADTSAFFSPEYRFLSQAADTSTNRYIYIIWIYYIKVTFGWQQLSNTWQGSPGIPKDLRNILILYKIVNRVFV